MSVFHKIVFLRSNIFQRHSSSVCWKFLVRKYSRDYINDEQPSEVHFQILGNGALGSPKNVLICAGENRYLFNCGEGTQHLFRDYAKSKFVGLANIFVTRTCWDNMGGLAGKIFFANQTSIINQFS